MDWRVAHDSFVAHAEVMLPAGPPPVTVFGVDETRRGKAHYEVDPATGKKTWVDRFDTGPGRPDREWVACTRRSTAAPARC